MSDFSGHGMIGMADPIRDGVKEAITAIRDGRTELTLPWKATDKAEALREA